MPQTLTIAQALQSSQSGLTVQDTAANIAAALPNPGLVARVVIFELSGAAAIATAAADKLAALGSKFVHGYPITVQDSVAAMTSQANATGLAIASTRQIIDVAYNLLNAPTSAFNGISAVLLSGTPTLTIAQTAKLESLPNFAVASGTHVAFSDSLANFAPALVAHPGWFSPASTITVHLDGAQVGANVATTLAALANSGKTVSFTPGNGDTTLNITAAAHDIASAASGLNRVAQMVGVHITVSNDGSAISAADAVALTTITGFAPAQHTLYVSDTGAAITAAGVALFNHGYPQIVVTSGNFRGIAALLLDPTLHVLPGATVTLTGTPTLTGAQIQVLAGLPGFALASGATLTIADTVANLVAHAGAMAAATAIVLTDSETTTAAGLTALAALRTAHPNFNLGGHTITVADTPANLAALGSQAITLSATYSLTANGAVSLAQLLTLRDTLHVAANGHSLTVNDTAANLLTLSGNLGLVSATQLSADATLTAAQAQTLAAGPAFSTGGHVLSVIDTAAALLGLSGPVQALAGHMLLSSDQSVDVSQAQALAALGSVFSDNDHALVVTGTASDLLSLSSGVTSIATGYGLSANATVSGAQFTFLIATMGVALDGHVLTVLDSPANLLALSPSLLPQAGAFALSTGGTVSEAQFITLRDGFGVMANGQTLTVADTAANLLALSGNLALDGATLLTGDATVSAAQAQSLATDPNFSTAGHVLTVADSAAALLALTSGVTAIAGGYALSADASVNAAQFTILATTLNVALNGHALTVSDTPANLLALPGQSYAQATGFSLSAGGTVSVAQFATLRDGMNVAGNGWQLTVADTAANLLSLSGNLSLIGATQLGADATVNAAQFTILEGGLHAGLNGHALTVSDTPANLLALPNEILSAATGFTLSAGGTVNEAQFLTLRDTIGVAGNGHTLTVSDTAPDLLALSGNLALDGATLLSADASVSAAQAQSLAADPNFSTAGHVLTVTDSAASLLALPSGVAAIAGGYALSADALVNAAQFTTLTATLNVALNGHALTVSDTPANLLALPSQSYADATGFSLSAGGTVSATQFTTLRDGMNVAGNGWTLTVTDTAANLLSLSGDLSLVGAMQLSADATVNAAQFTILEGTLHAGLNGHALTVSDTPANLLALPNPLLADATGFSLSAGGTVNEAQFGRLRDTMAVAGNGHSLTVTDNATNLLLLSGNLALVGATTLSADANVSAFQATSLAAKPGFGTGGHVLTIIDSAANLLGLSGGVQALAGHLVLIANQSVSVAQAASLVALGASFSTGGHVLTVTDTAANLLSLPSGVSAIAGAYALSWDAAVSASQFTSLVVGLNVSLNGYGLAVYDTPANLLALPLQTLSQASAFLLNAGGTVTESQFTTLRDTLGVHGNGYTLNLADSAANLLALSGSLALVGATQITADANVNASQASTLYGEPDFSTGGHVLTVTDTAANLLALPAGLQTLSGHLVLTASQSVTAAQAGGLAALGSAFSTGGHVLTVTDTAANLLSLPSGVAAIAGAYVLSADATVSVAQFTTLYATLGVALDGHALIVSDTPTNLLSVPLQALSQATGFTLSANGTVSEAQFVWLRDTANVGANGHTLTVSDTASGLLALSGNLALIGATQLSANANVSAAQAVTLAGEPGFSLGGQVLSVTDTAANLLALPSGVQTLSGHLILNASQSVNGAQASGLAALGGAFSTGGNTLIVTDTASNLLSLPSGVAAIAGGYALSADATVNAAQFTTLHSSLEVALNGHALTVSDTPANLLALPSQSLPYATGFSLSAGGTVSEAQFVTLRDVLGVAANGHTLTVSDTASDLLALTGNLALDGATQLSADATVTAAQAVTLAGEPGFATAGHVLTISDNAANLLSLSTGIQILSGHLVLSASQSVSAATATALAALGGAFSTGGNTLTVTDTAANLLSLPSGVTAIAGAYVLSADATVNAAQFTTLRDGLNVGLGGHAMTILDTAANLAALSGSLADASSCILSANGTVSAAGAAVLYGEPGFSTGGHILTIADTVPNLLALSSPLQALANAFTLSANQTVSVAQLAGLASYGIKFSDGNYTLGVVDTASNLAGLTTPELALVSSVTMSQSATISAATASTLAGLPAFALGSGVVMTVQDSAANLLALPSSVLSVAASEILPAGAVTLSAAQAAGLHAIAHFSTAGATVTVLDNVANLIGHAGWSSVASITHVADTAATLAAYDQSALLQDADIVTLTANATISAAQAASLATIGGYSTGAYTLTVADNAPAIAQNEAAIYAVGTTALVNTTTPVNAAQADQLALLATAGKLNFLAGDTLTVEDSYAALISGGNATGVALASNIVITDTAANLATATSHNWGNLVPTYVLAGSATISGAQAITLAGLGSHFQANGYSLSVQDSASNVLAAASALTSLGITATVADTAADIDAHANALAGLGGRLASVQVTDSSAISPATAAGLAPLAGKLSGSAIAVAGSAASVDANVAALQTLGAHVAITVSDSAASVGTYVSDLASLGNALTVSLTDVSPVGAAIAAGVEPLSSRLVSGTSVAVTDSVTNIAAVASTLSELGSVVGTITLSGSTAASVSQAVALLPLDSHLGTGVGLAVTGTAGDITSSLSSLLTLRSDGHLTSVTDSGESAAIVIANESALNEIGAVVHVSDTLADFNAQMSGLAGVSGLASVFINDMANPTFTLSLSQYAAEGAVIGLVTNTHNVIISDTASAIEADLASGSSILEGISGVNYSVSVIGGAPLVLSQAVAIQPAVAAVLLNFGGTLQVTGVDVAHLPAVAAVASSGIALVDSTTNIETDLGLPANGSVILADNSAISSIAATGGGTIGVTAFQALRAGFDDGPNSVFAKLTGAGLVVTDASVTQANTLIGAIVPPVGIYVDDTAANITAALINPSSPIMTALNTIVNLNVQDGNAIVLTEAQDVAANVNDSSSAALTKVSGGAIDVTGVTTAELGAVEGGAVTPSAVYVADTGADISGALTTLLSDRANLGSITVTSGQVVLTVSQALTTHVADGAGSLVSLLPGHGYAVSGVTVAQISSLTALAQAPDSIEVSDSSANIAADLAGSNSQIATIAGSVSVTGGTLSLTDAQARGIISNSHQIDLSLISSGQTIDITAVPVSDIGTFSALNAYLEGGVTLHLEVTDTALALATDLGMGSSSLLTDDAFFVHSVTLTGSGGTLNAAQLTAVAGISGLNANGYHVHVGDNASNIAGLGAGARALAGSYVNVTDTIGNVGAVLDALQSEYDGNLIINVTNPGTTLTVSAATYVADKLTIDAITTLNCIIVSGGAAAIAAIAPTLTSDLHVAAVHVIDNAANIVGNLGAISALGTAATVTLSDTNPISASIAQALVNANLPHLVPGSVTVADTGAQIAAMAESGSADVTFLINQGAGLTATSNVTLVDAQALAGITGLAKNGHTINVWDTAAYLTAPGAAAALNTLTTSSFIGGIYLKTTGGTVTLTAANTLALFAISGISIANPDSSANTITVADSAANLDSNRAALQSAGGSHIAAYVINASATVSGTVLSDLQGISATAASGVALTLSDTAANILTAAAVNGATVQASAWHLSADASVTSSQVLTLAALPNFSTAGHTLTVALGSNTAVGSVAQANELGALGANLIVTGHVYTISGSVSSLSGLTAAGAAVAHVALNDTFGNVASLTASSPLLTGTIAVNDVSDPTAAAVQSFLGLLSAAGVADGNVSFPGGAQIQVYDTVADLRTLTSSTAWSGNAALQSHIPLTAYDSAADLDDSANTAFLNTLAGQVLSSSATVSAASATALRGLSNFALGGNTLTVSDTAANLLNSAYSTGLALASSIQLSGAASVNAAQAEQLLQTAHFIVNQTLDITDSSANLLDGTLPGWIAGDTFVHVSLASPETVNALIAEELASLQGFSDTANMNIVDSSSYLLAAGASAAEAAAASVSLAGDETVSANTILRLSEIPHFISTGGTLTLAGNDFANAPTLKAIADLGSHFNEGGHSLSLTQDDLGLTPAEYAQIQSDGFVANGHVLSALLVNDSITEGSNTLTLSATGVAGASVTIYDHSGNTVSTTVENSGNFTLSTPDTGASGNFSITETVNSVESAPVVVLTQSTLESLVSGASSSFANSGQIQVGSGEYISLYTAGASLPNAPSLVYDPNAHTISLDIPNSSPITLITLGAGTHPASLDPSEILIKHHG